MKSIIYIMSLGIILTNIWSCSDDSGNEIEAKLVAYFDLFEEEAIAHGIQVSISDVDLDGYIENIQTRGTLGQCKSFSDGSKQVVIDEPYWNQADQMEREFLIFHELGHCVLGRSHDDSKDGKGECLSIMQSGDDACDGSYTVENRAQLLEELFEQ